MAIVRKREQCMPSIGKTHRQKIAWCAANSRDEEMHVSWSQIKFLPLENVFFE